MKFGDELLDLTGRKVTVARVISRLSGAPLINFYIGFIMTFYAPPDTIGSIITPISAFVLCLALMVILPVVPIIYDAWREKIDLDVSSQEMRTRYFGFAIFCYIIAFGIYFVNTSVIMYSFAAAYIGVTTGVMLANLRTKVSVHTAGIAGPSTALIIVYGLPAMIVIIFWALVIWSRIVLEQHSIVQSLAGILLGIAITIPIYYFLYLAPVV